MTEQFQKHYKGKRKSIDQLVNKGAKKYNSLKDLADLKETGELKVVEQLSESVKLDENVTMNVKVEIPEMMYRKTDQQVQHSVIAEPSIVSEDSIGDKPVVIEETLKEEPVQNVKPGEEVAEPLPRPATITMDRDTVECLLNDLFKSKVEKFFSNSPLVMASMCMSECLTKQESERIFGFLSD